MSKRSDSSPSASSVSLKPAAGSASRICGEKPDFPQRPTWRAWLFSRDTRGLPVFHLWQNFVPVFRELYARQVAPVDGKQVARVNL